MRYLLCCLMFTAACVDNADVVSPDMCSDLVYEQKAAVPYPWAVGTDTETYTMKNGCSYTMITHYVYDPNSDGSSSGPGGNAQPASRQCYVDGCGGPLDRNFNGYTDPAELINNMMPNEAN